MSQTVAGPKGGLQPNTAIAGAIITKGQQLKRGADQNTLIPNTAATIESVAVAQDDQDIAGRTVPIIDQPGELCLVRAGATFALDAKLTSDGTGRSVTAASTNKYFAIAREAATAVDQLVTAQLVSAGSVAP
jgi:hypothetical protein